MKKICINIYHATLWHLKQILMQTQQTHFKVFHLIHLSQWQWQRVINLLMWQIFQQCHKHKHFMNDIKIKEKYFHNLHTHTCI